ncbi:MAG: spore germination protein, partial [Clostridiaceae bacterium]|nr:spore germination protein [Clostridiaceae bacterium]
RGPREGFTEHIISNISLIRRRIKNPNLKFKFLQLGKQTNTTVCITYIEGVALESVLVELEQRLNRIDIDGILDSGYIQELIEDSPLSTFPTIGYTERPDVVVARMLEGRIAVIVDGSPFVLTVPHIFIENIQVSEDYYDHFIFGSFNRFLRTTASIATISIPAVYLALVTYHQEMIPTQLLITLSASLEGVPLPTSLSLIIMLIIFDVLREAGARMPSAVGQTVNIVGTLVLGQAAVEAQLVSAPVIIITAISGITTLVLPTLIESVVLLRLFLLVLSSFMGLYGYFIGIILIFLHLMSIRSFGVPYMMSITRFKDHDGQDSWIRAPWWSMTLRPKIIGAKNLIRQISRHNRR